MALQFPATPHLPSNYFNSQYLGGANRLTSWRQAIVPQNTVPYALSCNRQFGISSFLITSSPGSIYSFYAINKNVSVRYLSFFNARTIPTFGSSPSLSFLLPVGSPTAPSEIILGTDFFGPNGIAFTSGISWGISTSETIFMPTLTPSDHTIQVNYC